MYKFIIFVLFFSHTNNLFALDDWDRRFIRTTCKYIPEEIAELTKISSELADELIISTEPRSPERKKKLEKYSEETEKVKDFLFSRYQKTYKSTFFDKDFYGHKLGFAIDYHEGMYKWSREMIPIWGLRHPRKPKEFFERIIYEECIQRFME